MCLKCALESSSSSSACQLTIIREIVLFVLNYGASEVTLLFYSDLSEHYIVGLHSYPDSKKNIDEYNVHFRFEISVDFQLRDVIADEINDNLDCQN